VVALVPKAKYEKWGGFALIVVVTVRS